MQHSRAYCDTSEEVRASRVARCIRNAQVINPGANLGPKPGRKDGKIQSRPDCNDFKLMA
jgi:hypothetical protein